MLVKDKTDWKIVPTDRYFIKYPYSDTEMDYGIIDAIVIRIEQWQNDYEYKTFGVHFRHPGCITDAPMVRLGVNGEKQSLTDELEMKDLERMVNYLKRHRQLTRQEALSKIKRDFSTTRVLLSNEVYKAFSEVD